MTQGVVVVGAGIAGVMAARALLDFGKKVLVVDAAPTVGGRLSSRLVDGERVNDGAPFFTANDHRFREALAPFIAQGEVVASPGRWHRWQQGQLVAESLMNSRRRLTVPDGLATLVASLARGLDVRTSTCVGALSVESGQWRVHFESGEAELASGLVLALPGPDALQLARTAADAFNPLTLADVARVAFDPCVVVVAGYDAPAPAWQAIKSDEGPVSWMGVEAGKRGSAQTVVVVHGSADWSRGALDRDDPALVGSLLEAAAVAGGRWLTSPRWARAVRWKHARPVILASARAPASEGIGPPVVFCGDWCAAPHVEGAFLSGAVAGERMAFMV